MSALKEFVADLMDRYLEDLDETAAKFIYDDFIAGEYETASITTIEAAPISDRELATFEKLAADHFDGVDVEIARRVVAKRRKQLAS